MFLRKYITFDLFMKKTIHFDKPQFFRKKYRFNRRAQSIAMTRGFLEDDDFLEGVQQVSIEMEEEWAQKEKKKN